MFFNQKSYIIQWWRASKLKIRKSIAAIHLIFRNVYPGSEITTIIYHQPKVIYHPVVSQKKGWPKPPHYQIQYWAMGIIIHVQYLWSGEM
jgi:hypothetical protein